MKKISFSVIAILVAIASLAQVPQAFKYQAIARDQTGNVLSMWNVNLRISLIQEGVDDETIYVEIHKVQTNIYGLINLIIGEGEVVKGDFSTIKWGEHRHYIKMEMDIDNGENFKEVGTSQLYAVPYALYAEKAGDLVEPVREETESSEKVPQSQHKSTGSTRNGTPNTKFPATGNSYANLDNGNLGVGTSTPSEKLEVNGKIKGTALVLTDANGHVWEIQMDTTGNIKFVGIFNQCGDWLYDARDGQNYPTVQIGTQCWMARNLNIGTRINGDDDPDPDEDSFIAKYCYDDLESNCDIYGGLYHWKVAMDWITEEGAQGICLTGWHVPTDGEWTTLTTYLGGITIAGGKMKSTGTIETGTGLWYAPNDGATNESGFTGLPGGYRDYDDGSFGYLGELGYFWSSSRYQPDYPRYHKLDFNYIGAVRDYEYYEYGFSVRCLKDD
jgi:uncharacterized protein (TIGR02145 family)